MEGAFKGSCPLNNDNNIVEQPPMKRSKTCHAKTTSDENLSDVRIQTSLEDVVEVESHDTSHLQNKQLRKLKIKANVKSHSRDLYYYNQLREKAVPGLAQEHARVNLNLQVKSETGLEISSDGDSDEWQEVEDIISGELDCESETATSHKQEVLNENAIEICINVPESTKGKVSRASKFDWAKHVQWQVNRYNKAFQLQIHKAHLVCLLAGALHMSKMCNSAELQARALSQVPIDLLLEDSQKCSFANNWLEETIKWLIASFKVNKQDSRETGTPNSDAVSQYIETMLAPGERHFIHVCLVTLRALGLQARLVHSFQPVPIKSTMLSKVGNRQSTKNEYSKKGQSAIKTKTSTQGKGKLSKASQKTNPSQLNEKIGQIKSKKRIKDCKSVLPEGHKRTPSTLSSITDVSSDSDPEGDIISKVPLGSYFPSSRQRRNTTNMTNRQILSSASEDDNCEDLLHSPQTGRDSWIEVYSITHEKWICVDCVEGHLNRPDLCEQNATKPISYVVAVDNDNNVKDVTKRYASKWMFETEKLRVQSGWWEDTLKPYNTKLITRDKQEDAQLYNQLQERPLPTSISRYKNHHLYVLKRHLLKFEALYPESAPILGYCKGEAVYSRDCVHALHTKETWLKEGLTIQADEKPYKMVKARPKMTKSVEPLLQLYGKWQTELYMPPPAVDGKVPRNEYGNVELFQPSMLPMGTVHLQIPGLHQTARKLGVDCAPAMVGWDYHGGFSHPVLDGYIVCKEFQEILLDAWEQDQTVREKKEKQKRESRIAKNWRNLVNGLLISERLNERFRESNSADTSDGGNSSYWPLNKL